MGDLVDDFITPSNGTRKMSLGVVRVSMEDEAVGQENTGPQTTSDLQPEKISLVDGKAKPGGAGRSPSPTGKDFRTRLSLIFHSKAFQIAVVGLCCIDGLFVITTLLLEIEVLRLKPSAKRYYLQTAQFVLECSSATIVSLFVIEIPIKIWLFGYHFFIKHYLELIDALVSIISFTVDIYNITRHLTHKKQQHHVSDSHQGKKYTGDTLAEAAGLLVLFRLWRVVRIVNAIIMSVITTQEGQMNRLKTSLTTAQNRIAQLESLIKTHGIDLPAHPSTTTTTTNTAAATATATGDTSENS